MKGDTDVIAGSTTKFCAACGRDLSIPESMIPGCSSCSASSKPPQPTSEPPSGNWPQPSYTRGEIDTRVQAADPTIGETVLYVLPDGPNAGSPRPAIIIDAPRRASNQVLLWVITAGSVDGPKWQNPVRVLASFSYRNELNTWHRRSR